MFRTRLYLLTPPLSSPEQLTASLPALIAAGEIACIWLRLAPGLDDRAQRSIIEPLAKAAAAANAALLIDPPADERLVARWGADGIHLGFSPEGVTKALTHHKPDRIVGVGGLRSRDEAMSAGESGVDYVMFGEPRADGSLPELAGVLERCQWWAEVFNTPAVGYAPTLADVPTLKATGVEFVAVGEWVWTHPGGAEAAIATVRALLDAKDL